MTTRGRTLVLFNYDWNRREFARLADRYPHDSRGFDLFSFPSNLQLAWFDLERFVERLAKQAKRRGWTAVTSNHAQFGALAAALLAERMGWPGTPVEAILSCQHKLYARRILERVSPELNIASGELSYEYMPIGLRYPTFVKPVKATLSALARTLANREELHFHTRFTSWERWVIRQLTEPFDHLMRKRLPNATSVRQMMFEDVFEGRQYNLDAYVFRSKLYVIGCVDSSRRRGSGAFMRFDYPSHLAQAKIARFRKAIEPFLREVNFTHGLLNVEFFLGDDDATMKVIEFNPGFSSQFSDLYRRVDGIDLHEYALTLAHGINPTTLFHREPSAGTASSFNYRSFDPNTVVEMPTKQREAELYRTFPDALLFVFRRDKSQIALECEWLGSYRYGILHLGGRDKDDLRSRFERASEILGWSTADVCADEI